ncbi:hypothetical protein BH24PSE2_BH24PSE2_17390 [soil metagenome]
MSGAGHVGGRDEAAGTREQLATFEAALRAYFRDQLDFATLRQELEDALYADLACAPLTLELIEHYYQQGRLPPRPYTALKDDVEKTVAEAAGRTEVLAAPSLDDREETQEAQSFPEVGSDRTMPIERHRPPRAEPAARPEQGTGREREERAIPQGVVPRPTSQPRLQPKPKAFEAGHVLRNRFVLEERIGAGGMGIVYRALDRRKQEAHDGNPYVALKILRHEIRQRPDSLSSLQQEALKAQRLSHPNIVNVFDFDRDGDAVFMTMELLEGESLARLLSQPQRRLPREQAIAIIAGMSRGLAYAHEQNIIHYDFKPGNVFLTHDGRIKLLDFGIARAAPEEALYTFDSEPVNAMTPAYASCEMLQGGEPDPRDDVYGLACVSYELLAGRHPFCRQSAVRARQLKMRPPRIKGLKRSQWRALERGLRFTRSERTSSAGEFLLEMQGNSPPKPESEVAFAGLVKRPPRRRRRRRKQLGVALLALLVAAVAYFSEVVFEWMPDDSGTRPGEIAAPGADDSAASDQPHTTSELETMDPVPDPTIVPAGESPPPTDDETLSPQTEGPVPAESPDERAPAEAPAADTPAPEVADSSEPMEAGAQPVEGSDAAPTPTTSEPLVPDPAAPPATTVEQGGSDTAPETASEAEPDGATVMPAQQPVPAGPAHNAESAPAAAPGRIGFARRDYSIGESGSVAVIEIRRTGGTSGDVAVTVATDDGTAVADSDYGSYRSTEIGFADGEESRLFYVPIVSDARVEQDEAFYVTLSDPTGGAELDDAATATVRIVDDDF